MNPSPGISAASWLLDSLWVFAATGCLLATVAAWCIAGVSAARSRARALVRSAMAVGCLAFAVALVWVRHDSSFLWRLNKATEDPAIARTDPNALWDASNEPYASGFVHLVQQEIQAARRASAPVALPSSWSISQFDCRPYPEWIDESEARAWLDLAEYNLRATLFRALDSNSVPAWFQVQHVPSMGERAAAVELRGPMVEVDADLQDWSSVSDIPYVEMAVVIQRVEWRVGEGPWQSMLPHPKTYPIYGWSTESSLIASSQQAAGATEVRCVGELSVASSASTASRRIPFEWLGH